MRPGYADLPDPAKVDLPRLAKPYGQKQLEAELMKLLQTSAPTGNSAQRV